jgi:hypothetical protein
MVQPRSHAKVGLVQRAFDWCFRNRKTGYTTIVQLPNLPLLIFLGTFVVERFVPDDHRADTYLDWIGVVALSWWALDEVVRGVNPWRRLLGLVVGALVVVWVQALVA